MQVFELIKMALGNKGSQKCVKNHYAMEKSQKGMVE